MNAPNRRAVVDRVWAEGNWRASQDDQVKAAFTRAVAAALHAEDARWGLVSVKPPHTQVNGLSTDLVMWQETGEIVDIVSDKGPLWGTTDKGKKKTPLPVSRWVKPEGVARPPSLPVPEPPQNQASVLDELRTIRQIADGLIAHLGG